MSEDRGPACHRRVAELHVANLDQGFLSTLGVGFVSLMYEAIAASPDSVLLVEERDGEVVGFVSAGAGLGSVYRRMLRRPLALTRRLLPIVFSVRKLLRVIEILRYGRQRAGASALPAAELLSIAVDPAYRGSGVAERLYARLVAEFARRGVDAFAITVGAALAPAHRFYRRMGAEPVGEVEVHRGEKSIVYVQRVRPLA